MELQQRRADSTLTYTKVYDLYALTTGDIDLADKMASEFLASQLKQGINPENP